MKFDLDAAVLAVNVVVFVWALVSICVRLHVSRSEVLHGDTEIMIGPFLSEYVGLIGSALYLSYSLFSRLNL